jgi:hypothetical protein
MASFVGGIWFGLMLGLAGVIAGYYVAKSKKF